MHVCWRDLAVSSREEGGEKKEVWKRKGSDREESLFQFHSNYWCVYVSDLHFSSTNHLLI